MSGWSDLCWLILYDVTNSSPFADGLLSGHQTFVLVVDHADCWLLSLEVSHYLLLGKWASFLFGLAIVICQLFDWTIYNGNICSHWILLKTCAEKIHTSLTVLTSIWLENCQLVLLHIPWHPVLPSKCKLIHVASRPTTHLSTQILSTSQLTWRLLSTILILCLFVLLQSLKKCLLFDRAALRHERPGLSQTLAAPLNRGPHWTGGRHAHTGALSGRLGRHETLLRHDRLVLPVCLWDRLTDCLCGSQWCRCGPETSQQWVGLLVLASGGIGASRLGKVDDVACLIGHTGEWLSLMSGLRWLDWPIVLRVRLGCVGHCCLLWTSLLLVGSDHVWVGWRVTLKVMLVEWQI